MIIPYNEALEEKKWLLKSAGIDIVFNYPNTLKKTMIKRKLTIPNENLNDNPGIYMIDCLTCPKKYIGETGRSGNERLDEHKRYLRRNLVNSNMYAEKAVVQHRALNHELDMKNASIIYKSNSRSTRLVLESSLIKSIPNFNISKGVYDIDPITLKLLKISVPSLPWSQNV